MAPREDIVFELSEDEVESVDEIESVDDESDWEDEDSNKSVNSTRTAGDIEGVVQGEGRDIIITQPAIDDVAEDFFPNEDDKDGDHLDAHELGYIHASSGTRRWKRKGIVHEIDWALIKIKSDRLQPYNVVLGGKRYCKNPESYLRLRPQLEEPVFRRLYTQEEDEYPTEVADSEGLGSRKIHWTDRNSGLQGGMIEATMRSVKFYGRRSFSKSWAVAGAGELSMTPKDYPVYNLTYGKLHK
ncbi:uncharacterized protein BDR25DRAFT_54431 [Lindgomyces ingoldianus]|uniref:Uncharacterized protein n=1 Tax=Lindgomyces ingoldianus TaxID=673940 RepID=A0ACB6QQ27_9PLEO|nr:uncharacterized protein BDR25DRAFT_54431 [Lindgomyces ingoldianus]KAF2468962.1 hypothetical protein BDR25DRAFT_54431 [Lindgomyces ingoldianus]